MSKISEIEKILYNQDSLVSKPDQFLELYQQFLDDQDKALDWSKISTPSDKSILNYEALENIKPDLVQPLLSELAVCRLNGDLGTSMGCVGPKSAIEVKDRGRGSNLELKVDRKDLK